MIAYAITVGAAERNAPPAGLFARHPLRTDGHVNPITLVISPKLDWLAGQRSLLIGQLFDDTNGRDILDGAALDQAIAKGEEHFLRRYSGRYLLLFEAERGEMVAIRDPSGAIPCYRGKAEGDFLCSDAGIARALGLIEEPEIDWDFIVHWLQFPFLRGQATGLKAIRELPPGARCRLGSPSKQQRQAWRPASLPSRSWSSIDAAAAELRLQTLRSVARGSGGALTLIQLSGGLDSSILAACLAAKDQPLHAVSFATASPEGDEEHYARSVADHLGVPLTMVREDDAALAIPSPSGFRPGINLLLAPIDQLIELARREIGADLVVDGGGGDSLFGTSRSAAPILDGFREGQGWRTMRSVAERSQTSLLRVAHIVLRQSLRSRRPEWQEDRLFLGPAAIAGREGIHPWLEGAASLPRGSAEHLVSLVHIQHFLDRHAIGGDHRHPLMNQRLIELCLSIPSWMWNADGRDRAVARRAFADMLPARIIDRRTKGSLQGYFHRRFRVERPRLRALLLEGELARRELIDRAAIEAALADDRLVADERAMRLSEIATLEDWLAGWRLAGAA